MIDPKKPLGTSYVLSESDRDKFARLWLEHAHALPQPKQDRGHFPDHEEHQAPEVYVAKTPPGGIAGRTGVVPASAECDIYQLIVSDLTITTGLTQPVYNLATDSIDGDSFVVIARDKYGRWYVTGGTGGSGVRALWVQSLQDGYSVLVQGLADNGNGHTSDGLDPFQAVVPSGNYPRDPAISGGIYIALKSQGSGDGDTGTGTGTGTGLFSGWYIETGPKTICRTIVTAVNCVGEDLIETTEELRVFDRDCP